MSLTQEEKEAVQKSWALVRTDIPTHGTDLFLRFFTENPTYQENFASFKSVPVSELRGNKRLLAHATSVMYAISSLVDNLDDTELIVEMLQKTGSNHARRHITAEMFKNLGNTIVGLLEDKLGPEVMTPEVTAAWVKTYGVILSVVEGQLNKS